jgi:hypothetical protein
MKTVYPPASSLSLEQVAEELSTLAGMGMRRITEKRFLELCQEAKARGWGREAFPERVSREEALIYAGGPPPGAPATREVAYRFLPLHWAVRLNFGIEQIEAAAALGFAPQDRDEAQGVPAALSLAVGGERDPKTVGAKLIELGSRADERLAPRGEAPMHRTAHLRDGRCAEWVDFLHGHGASLDAKDQFGLTPLMMAVKAQNQVAVLALIERGADVGAADNEGRAALHHAMEAPGMLMPQTLLLRGADWAQRDARGRTPLHFACGAGVARAHAMGIAEICEASSREGAKLPESLDALRDAEGKLPSEWLAAMDRGNWLAHVKVLEDMIALREATAAPAARGARSSQPRL